MMICALAVLTDKAIYNEQFYGVIESIDRVSEIEKCDNIIRIDIIDNSTGEVLYSQSNGNLPYVADTLIIELYRETFTEDNH